jgi:thymidine kinase
MDAERARHFVLIAGPMFCGKSSELQRRVRRTQYGPHPPSCLVITFARDTRYALTHSASDADRAYVVTHDGTRLPAVAAATVAEIRDAVTAMAPAILAIDEGQFFPGLGAYILDELLVAGSVHTVLVAALKLNFRNEPFAETAALLPHADEVLSLYAVCRHCGDEHASCSHRLVADTRDELIGGAESYVALCRACFAAAHQ